MDDDALEVAMRDIIRCSVMGQSKLWPIDGKFPSEGSLEERFNRDDKQILLWALAECARTGEPIPEWAGRALNNVIYAAVRGDLASWDEAFGKIFVDHRQGRAQSLALMLKVWARIYQRHHAGESKLEELFQSVGEEFGIGATLVKELHGKVRDAIDRSEWSPDPSLIESLTSEKAP
jgi:hypothetical protein